MPVLTRFPGGGGGSGYMYQSDDVVSPSISTGADNKIALQWQDPDDIFFNGKAMSEWKGTLVVCKKGAAPANADDGIVICDSRIKNRYKDSPLLTETGGADYYYGLFPYTKDYVVNVGSANILYCLGQLDGTSWANIAACSENGLAQQWWKIGDEKKVILSGDYNVEITLQIVGFNHDDLATNNRKAGITFLSKQVLAKANMNSSYTNTGGWRDSYMRNTIMPKIKNSLPEDLRRLIKKVKKISTEGNTSAPLVTTEDDLFIPSVVEVGGFDTAVGSIVGESYGEYVGYSKGEGIKYPIFRSNDDLIKESVTTENRGWWVRSAAPDNYSFSGVRPGGIKGGFMTIGANAGEYACGICFGLCV